MTMKVRAVAVIAVTGEAANKYFAACDWREREKEREREGCVAETPSISYLYIQ